MTRASAPAIEGIAALTQRLAVLLAAGVAPGAAWGYLADVRAPDPVVRVAARAAAEGDGVAAAVGRAARDGPATVRSAWTGLAAAWYVASESGAPLAQCLRDLAAAFRAIGETERDLRVALAGPAATARLVTALPFVGMLFGYALGFNTLGVLFTSLPGLACAVVGGGLLALGALWNRRMVRRATPTDLTPGLVIDLVAIAMSGGGSVTGARALVNRATERFQIEDGRAGSIDDVLSLAARAGVPAAELLRSEAEAARRQARTDGQHAAARLGVRLMLPLGVCVLPAFMLLGVAPVLLAIIVSTVSAF